MAYRLVSPPQQQAPSGRFKLVQPPSSQWGNLDPAQVPPRNPSIPFMEGLKGTIGNMLEGVPVAGPALLGAGERLSAAKQSLIGGKPYDQALEDVQSQQEQFSHDNPKIATSAQAGGSSLAMTALGAGLPRVMGVTGGNLLTRMGAGGASNAAVFGADAAARGNDPKEAAIAGAISGALGPTFSQFITPAGPTTPQLRATATAAINRFRQAGAVVSSSRVSQIMDDMLAAGRGVGMRPNATPKSWELTDDIQALRGNTSSNPLAPMTNQGVDLERLYQLRQDLGRIERTTDPIGSNQGDHDRTAAGRMGDVFDDFMEHLAPSDVIAGNPQQAQQALAEFRPAWATMRKAELMEEIMHRVGIDESKYSQSGRENALRAQFRTVVKNPRLMRGFSPEERRLLESVATGTFTQNRARDVGRFAVRGPVSAMASGGAFAVGGPAAGIGLAAAGEGGRQVAGAIGDKNARLAEALIRGGGQMPQLSGGRQSLRAIIQGLLGGGVMTGNGSLNGGGW